MRVKRITIYIISLFLFLGLGAAVVSADVISYKQLPTDNFDYYQITGEAGIRNGGDIPFNQIVEIKFVSGADHSKKEGDVNNITDNVLNYVQKYDVQYVEACWDRQKIKEFILENSYGNEIDVPSSRKSFEKVAEFHAIPAEQLIDNEHYFLPIQLIPAPGCAIEKYADGKFAIGCGLSDDGRENLVFMSNYPNEVLEMDGSAIAAAFDDYYAKYGVGPAFRDTAVGLAKFNCYSSVCAGVQTSHEIIESWYLVYRATVVI